MDGFIVGGVGEKREVEIDFQKLAGTVEYEQKIDQKLKSLSEIYRKLPDTICDNCGKCCSKAPFYGVGSYSIEFINIKRYMEEYVSSNEKATLIQKALNYDGERLSKTAKCVFRDDEGKRCIIYPVRPWGCRAASLIEDEEGCNKVKIVNSRRKKISAKLERELFMEIGELSDYYFYPEYGYTNIQGMRNWFGLWYKEEGKGPVKARVEEIEQMDEYKQRVEERLERLNQLYKKIPDADCSSRTNRGVCLLGVFVRAVEFENIQRYIDEYLKEKQKAAVAKEVLINYHMRSIYKQAGKRTSWRLKCPFRDDKTKRCIIYPVRPLACRANAGSITNLHSEISNINDYYYVDLDNDYITNVQLMEFWLMLKIVGAKDTFEVIQNDDLASKFYLRGPDFSDRSQRTFKRRIRTAKYICPLDQIS